MFRTFCLTAALALCLAAPATSSASWPYLGSGGYGWGYSNPTNYVPAPPYYAIHPPVYYSPHITARHYGASPFAWLPGMQPITYVPEPGPARRVMSAAVRESLLADAVARPATSAVLIDNPFVPAAKTASTPAAAEAQPLKIDNPFFASLSR
jgi:hypothetical protein